jgi:YD repeat-containing protein
MSEKLPVRKFPIQLVSITCGEGYVARSESPHPLVTLDYDEQGNLIEISVIGGDLRVDTSTNDPLDVAMLKGNPDLDRDEYVKEFERSQ